MVYLKKGFYIIVLLSFFLSACSTKSGPSGSNTNVPGKNPTDALSTPTAVAATPTDTPEPPTPTSVPTATDTIVPTATEKPIDTTTPVPATPACTNQATLVRHLSFADNSKIDSGLFFGKIWRLQNTGTCTWSNGYAFVFSNGEQMNAPAETPLSQEVPPGETIDIKLLMKAPDVANTYSGNWMLRDANGVLFGTGANADQPIEVIIVVTYPSTKDFHPFPECG